MSFRVLAVAAVLAFGMSASQAHVFAASNTSSAAAAADAPTSVTVPVQAPDVKISIPLASDLKESFAKVNDSEDALLGAVLRRISDINTKIKEVLSSAATELTGLLSMISGTPAKEEPKILEPSETAPKQPETPPTTAPETPSTVGPSESAVPPAESSEPVASESTTPAPTANGSQQSSPTAPST